MITTIMIAIVDDVWVLLVLRHVPIKPAPNTANPPTNIADFRGFDSSVMLI